MLPVLHGPPGTLCHVHRADARRHAHFIDHGFAWIFLMTAAGFVVAGSLAWLITEPPEQERTDTESDVLGDDPVHQVISRLALFVVKHLPAQGLEVGEDELNGNEQHGDAGNPTK